MPCTSFPFRSSTPNILLLMLVAGATGACGDDDATSDAGGGGSGECTRRVAPGDDDQETLQGALIDAQSGDTLCLDGGRYALTGQLSLAVANVTVRGEEGTVLDFSDQSRGANGFEITADGDVLEHVRIENPHGDGVRATQVEGVTLRDVHVEWTDGPSPDNGGYGLYPVSSSRVLIEDCYVKGASDAGIYVGQSHTIVVRDSEVTGNVAGIEIENSTDAEVYGNQAHDNVGGILLFNLPGLRVGDGKRANVHDNVITDNNHENFAPAGNIVHDVPSGTGMFILASDDNEVHANEIRGHRSFGLSVLSWFVALRDEEGMMDPEFDWYPERNAIHDNALTDNGQEPQDNAMVIASLVGVTELGDMVWDGIVDAAKLGADAGAADEDGGTPGGLLPPESLRNCFHGNGGASFLNADLEHYGENKSTDVAPYDCERPALAPVTL